MIVLDTNVVSELMRDEPARIVVRWMDDQSQDSLFVTSVTLAEVLYGIRRLPVGRRRTRLESGLRLLMQRGFAERLLPFDGAAADAYSQIVVDRQRSGRPIEPFDAMIAGIALTRGTEIATRDIEDFQDCGVELINPWV